MRKRYKSMLLLAVLSLSAELVAGDLSSLPRLSMEVDPRKQSYREQKNLPDLAEAYVSTSPEDLGDGLQVGRLDLPGTEDAVKALISDDRAGKYSNLDSLLIWKDGKLIFEMYNRRGRVNAIMILDIKTDGKVQEFIAELLLLFP